ncbi:MAG TPA: hypothetical protein VK053_11860 [Jiangellaceae bacterium]|nr:hypothetical protein [Jiangellaceae bacterium]
MRKALDPGRVNQRAEPVWDPKDYPHAWRAAWQYRQKRALRNHRTLNQQRNQAIAIIEGDKKQKRARFVKEGLGGAKSFDENGYQQNLALAGWKGYISNIEARIMPAAEVISAYHELWHVEESFRMSKSDRAARPIFHRIKDSIEAHLTVVFAALAVSQYVQDFPPQIPADEQAIIDAVIGGEVTH